MTDATRSSAAGEGLFLTYDSFVDEVKAVLSEARKLEEASNPAGQALASGLEERIRTLIARGRRTGTILDSFKERRDFQKELDYLAKVLERFNATPEDVSLEPFEPAALAAIPVPAFPFDDIRQQRERTPTPSREDIQTYLLKTGPEAGLRFDDGLVEEIAVQLSGDPEAWPLLWCCLWNLHARLSQEKLGNKLLRPKGSTSFDCRSFAADVLRRAYSECDAEQKSPLKRVLIEFGLSRRTSGAQSLIKRVLVETGVSRDTSAVEPSVVSIKRIRSVAGAKASDIVARLNAFRLLWEAGEEPGETSYCLVHRALLERWGELATWVEAEKSRRKQIKAVVGMALLFGILGGAYYSYARIQAETEANSKETAYRSLDLLSLNSSLALATAVEAVCIRETPLALESVARALDGRREKDRFYPPEQDRQLVVAGYSGNGLRVLTADADGTTKVWDPLGKKRPLELQKKYPGVGVTAFDRDGHVALAHQCQEDAWCVQTINLETGQAVSQGLGEIPKSEAISALALTGDGTRIAVGTDKGHVQIYGAGKLVRNLPQRGTGVSTLAFNADGTLLVTAYEPSKVATDPRAIVWKVENGEALDEIAVEPIEVVVAAGFERPGGQALIITQVFDPDNPVVKVRSGPKGRTSDKFRSQPVKSATLDPNGAQILFVDLDGNARVWDRASKRDTLTVRSSASNSSEVGVFSPDGAEVAIKNNDSTIRLWDIRKAVLLNLGDAIRSATSAGGNQWAVGTAQGAVYLLDGSQHKASRLSRQEPSGQAAYSKKSVSRVSYSADGEKVAAVYPGGMVQVWNAKSGQPLRQIDASKGKSDARVTCISFSPDGKTLATTNADGSVAIWDGNAEKPTSPKDPKPPEDRKALCAAFTGEPAQSGRLTIVWSDGQVSAGAGLSDQKPMAAESSDSAGIKLKLKSAAISRDGTRLAAVPAVSGRDVVLYSAERGWSPLPGARKLANFTADSSRVGTVDWDGGVSVWDANSLRRVARFEPNRTLTALDPEGRSVLVAEETFWRSEDCWACGPILNEDFKKQLKAEARRAWQGMAGYERFGLQFPCISRSKDWSAP